MIKRIIREQSWNSYVKVVRFRVLKVNATCHLLPTYPMFPFTSFRKYTDGNISYWHELFDKAYLITVFEATETLNQSKCS